MVDKRFREMPHVKLFLKGELAVRLPGAQADFKIQEDTTLGAFLSQHNLEARHYVIVLNNIVAPPRTSVLSDGDLIVVYPQMAGG